MSERENTPLQAVWDGMNRVVELSGLITDAQHIGVAYAIASVVGDAPDALFGLKRNPCAVGEILYTFYWVKGGSFGKAEVVQPEEGHSAALATTCWIRPLAGIRKIDVEFNVTAPPAVRTEYVVKQRITAQWDDESVVLDGTGSMASYARPELEKLIGLVLAAVRES